jgi:tetratricopeptide (TPR) repeat protein
VNLGVFLEDKGWSTVTEGASLTNLSMAALAQYLQTNKPSPVLVERAKALMAESRACFNHAVEAAPGEVEVYERRGAQGWTSCFLQLQMRQAQGEKIDSNKDIADYFSGGGREDLNKIVTLSPTNYLAIGTAVLSAAVPSMVMMHRQSLQESSLWLVLPEDSRQLIRNAITLLQKIQESPNSRAQAGACEVEGFIKFLIMNDTAGAEQSARRAVALDPSRKQSWELFLGILASSGRITELAAVSESRLKSDPSARNYLVHAKALFKLNQFDKSGQQVKQALRLEPDNVLAHMAVAALMLKRADEESLKDAFVHLNRAKTLMGDSPLAQQAVDLCLLSGFYFALNDKPAMARGLFEQILNYDSNDADAKNALAALGDH